MKRPRQRKLPPIRTWHEKIDDMTIAGMAHCQEVRISRAWVSDQHGWQRRRMLYAASAFVLCDRAAGWRNAVAAAHARLFEHLQGNAHRLKCVGLAEGIEE